MAPRLVLASASPARLFLLESAGLAPEVIPSGDEEGGVEGLSAPDAVLVLATRKAEVVAAAVARERSPSDPEPLLVVGCDSLFELEGHIWGKPPSRAEVMDRWHQMRGKEGLLHTGHCVVNVATQAQAAATDSAVVRFGHPTDQEIEAYAATAESLLVAGPFTLEGLSAPWIDSIDGNYGTITGVSLATLRRLMRELGVEIIDFWS